MFGLKKRKRNDDRRRTSSRSQSPIRTARRLFHAVCISTGEMDSCEAVKDLEGVRFLSEDAPMLPLRECTNPAGCRCKYQHFDDRRTDARRESDIGLPVKHYPNDVRDGAGRRVTDA